MTFSFHCEIIFCSFRFEGVGSKTVNKRAPDDKAMQFEKKDS